MDNIWNRRFQSLSIPQRDKLNFSVPLRITFLRDSSTQLHLHCRKESISPPTKRTFQSSLLSACLPSALYPQDSLICWSPGLSQLHVDFLTLTLKCWEKATSSPWAVVATGLSRPILLMVSVEWKLFLSLRQTVFSFMVCAFYILLRKLVYPKVIPIFYIFFKLVKICFLDSCL